MLMISDISETWVPPHGHPGFSPNLKTRGVLPWKVSKHRNLSLIILQEVKWLRTIYCGFICYLFSPLNYLAYSNWIPINQQCNMVGATGIITNMIPNRRYNILDRE